MTFWRNRVPERQFNREWKGGFGSPECWQCEVPIRGKGTEHKGITTNFVQSILQGTPLLAPGEEGIKGLTISNAIHLSAWTNEWVDLPIDEDKFVAELQDKIANSTTSKAAGNVALDVSGTH